MEINKYNLDTFCCFLNDIIFEAVTHGGDSGGPYFSNQEDLEKTINNFLIWAGLEKDLIVYKDRIPKVLEKNKVF